MEEAGRNGKLILARSKHASQVGVAPSCDIVSAKTAGGHFCGASLVTL